MKKLLWMLPLAFFASCVTIPKPQHYTATAAVDYTVYSNRGFFITESNSVSFDYTPVSSILVETRSGYKIDGYTEADPRENNDMYQLFGSVQKKEKVLGFVNVTIKSALDELYDKATDLGANGIINLKISSFSEIGEDNGKAITLRGYRASGMAIKR